MDTPSVEILKLLQDFSGSPERHPLDWINKITIQLSRMVEERDTDDFGLIDCLEVVADPDFESALQRHYRALSLVEVDTARLVRNIKSLINSAWAALQAIQDSANNQGIPGPLLDQLMADTAAAMQPVFGEAVSGDANFVREPVGHDAAATLQRAFLSARLTSVAPLFWAMHWINSNRRLLVSGHKTRVPVIAADSRLGGAHVAHLECRKLLDGSLSEFVEDPSSALNPFGFTLLQTLEKAWRLAPPHSVTWLLESSGVPQDGNSLGGAAAVAFRKVFRNEAYIPGFVVLAALGEQEELIHVHELPAKIRAAQQRHLVKIVIPPFTNDLIKDEDRREWQHAHIDLITAATIDEACLRTEGFGSDGLPKSPTGRVLEEFSLVRELPTVAGVRRWLAEDHNHANHLVKLWPFSEDERDTVVRRILWDRELRTLYRLSSSPAAEKTLMVLHTAGIDRAAGYFVMVLTAEGYLTLAECIADRTTHSWLAADALRTNKGRRKVWSGLSRIANGLEALHKQSLVHWNVIPENVFLVNGGDSDSWRLGGFEWSKRFGTDMPANQEPVGNWHRAPEYRNDPEQTLRQEHDWYSFGVLAARLFYPFEGLANLEPAVINKQLNTAIRNQPNPLQPIESQFILDLIASEPKDRARFAHDILTSIRTIFEELAEDPRRDPNNDAPLILRIDPRKDSLIKAATAAGFRAMSTPEAGDSTTPQKEIYTITNLHHVAQLKAWMKDNFRSAAIYGRQGSDEDQFLLVGRAVNLMIVPNAEVATWNEAFAVAPWSLQHGGPSVDISTIPLEIVHLREPVQGNTRRWDPLLPKEQKNQGMLRECEDLWKFLRCTNQLELILRWAEVIPYKRLAARPQDATDPRFPRFRIQFDEKRMSPVLKRYQRTENPLVEFFQRELEAGKRDWDKVVFSVEPTLRWLEEEQGDWRIDNIVRPRESSINPEAKLGWLEIVAGATGGGPHPPPEGYVRSFGLRGQTRLIERRRKAIDRLEDHTYLLKAIANPGRVYIDTRQESLNALPDPKAVDESKKAIMLDILRTRPIYALQGPPGTGKSTLVAHLLRQILAEDPVAQILITAQAHGAVDVLLEKVQDVFLGERPERKPITVRLLGRDQDPNEASSPVNQDATQVGRSKSILEYAIGELSALPNLHLLQQEWVNLATKMAQQAISGEGGQFTEFSELVKRGAHCIFCTTSSGDLEELAKGEQLFDWVIVEEAGKVHGYDLALPLQAGHRWFLLGDHKQLAPYREDDFQKALGNLKSVANELNSLSGIDRSLLDQDWLDEWTDNNQEHDKDGGLSPYQEDFQNYAKGSIRIFREIYNRAIKGANNRRTLTQSNGAIAGFLSQQYRMNPKIGELISSVFYEGLIRSETSDDLIHQFVEPVSVIGKPIVWIDLPWSKDDPDFEEQEPTYTNPKEIEAIVWFLRRLRFRSPPSPVQKVAVLAPYSQQVRALNRRLQQSDCDLPYGLEYRDSLFARRGKSGTRRAHTVDSFQGNQADIVIVSLTRNNMKPPMQQLEEHVRRSGLGFLDQEERVNVLLSRAERMLVLVGSLKFLKHQIAGAGPTGYLSSWLRLVRRFEELEKSNHAVRIDAATQLEQFKK